MPGDLDGVDARALNKTAAVLRAHQDIACCVTRLDKKDASIVLADLLARCAKLNLDPAVRRALALLDKCVAFGEERCRELLMLMGIDAAGATFESHNFLRSGKGTRAQAGHWDTLSLYSFIVLLVEGELTLVAQEEPMPSLDEAVAWMQTVQPKWDLELLKEQWGVDTFKLWLPLCVRAMRRTPDTQGLVAGGRAPKGTVTALAPAAEHAGPEAAEDRWALFLTWTPPEFKARPEKFCLTFSS